MPRDGRTWVARWSLILRGCFRLRLIIRSRFVPWGRSWIWDMILMCLGFLRWLIDRCRSINLIGMKFRNLWKRILDIWLLICLIVLFDDATQTKTNSSTTKNSQTQSNIPPSQSKNAPSTNPSPAPCEPAPPSETPPQCEKPDPPTPQSEKSTTPPSANPQIGAPPPDAHLSEHTPENLYVNLSGSLHQNEHHIDLQIDRCELLWVMPRICEGLKRKKWLSLSRSWLTMKETLKT